MDARAVKLSKHLNSIIHGHDDLTPRKSGLFLEAIYTAPETVTCISKIVGSEKGLDRLCEAMRFDLTLSFLNGPATLLLKYLSAPELTHIGGGTFLLRALLSIVEPPIFWTEFAQAFRKKQLQGEAEYCFAWVLLQLIRLPKEPLSCYRELAQDQDILTALLSSPRQDIREIAQTIKQINATCSTGSPVDLDCGPGGRHDNDFANFREIAILPTGDELLTQQKPFLRTSSALEDPETDHDRIANHLDNQFRLLREDMLSEMRDDVQLARGLKKGKYRGMILDRLVLGKIHTETNGKTCKWGITFSCSPGIDFWQFKKVKHQDRQAFLKDNRRIFPHQSIVCLIVDDEIVAFPTVHRDEKLLARKPPTLVLQFEGPKSNTKALLQLCNAKNVKLLSIDTALFAYEPILRALQDKQSLSLARELLFWTADSVVEPPPSKLTWLVDSIKKDPCRDLQALLETDKKITLDRAQADSLISGLSSNLSLILGPPGTGKSFIGALLAKALHDFAKSTILVVCYTNHALDQFLEDLLDIGIPHQSIVRLGGNSTPRTANLALREQVKTSGFRMTRTDRTEIDRLKSSIGDLSPSLERAFKTYTSRNPQSDDILQHLEFKHPDFFDAFHVPQSRDGMKQVGRRGRAVGRDYLLDRWSRGLNAGTFSREAHVRDASEIWTMASDARRKQFECWKEEIMKEVVQELTTVGEEHNRRLRDLDQKFRATEVAVLRSKHIIGCTTTAAAKYRDSIDAARPDVLLVEEAGEILESHIITALGAETKHLILIGDHKQLRPKVYNYMLTVEKGEGFDLNRSLFERLVLRGYPHQTLRQQHRMRPEIASLVRELTYPDLQDAPKTRNRSDLCGVRDNVVFINHEQPEDDFSELEGPRDMSSKSSKRNRFEVQMVLKIVRYLGQQGYGTNEIVILTPYLGQLRELQEALKKDNDPVINDLDSHDLVRAGLISKSAAKLAKKPIRLATIDNYQGEESKVIIASLTRSNSNNDIGFMSSPERLTVLLSRARDAFIMIGNAHTFTHSRKGSEIWEILISLLGRKGHVYDGLPVKCERHPQRTALLKCPDDFDKECPDGGCLEPCNVTLKCGQHQCPSKCHQLSDHSKMRCEYVMYSKCPTKGHEQQWKCDKGPPQACVKCDREAAAAEKKRQEEFARREKREAEQRLHDQHMAELDAKIAQQRDSLRDAQLEEERKRAVGQKTQELRDTAILAARAPGVPDLPVNVARSPPANTPQASQASSHQPIGADGYQTVPPNATSSNRAPSPVKSNAREEWQRQKNLYGELNDAIDSITEMTGLEAVKEQVLRIKDKADTSRRQNSSLTGERFNVCMLGNPGTGKTTVARHYAKFLATVGVIPGNAFIETTGSRLANDGVPGIKKQLETLIENGGGTMFIDEAYQLTDAHNFQGKQVLDFLLAEMENNVGKVVFIFAGYNREMEKFFEHNPGLSSRVPYKLQFKDYEDTELMEMLEGLIEKTWNGRMKVGDHDGIRGLYGRIAVCRLGRGRGRNGFGNARALANMFAKIRERQSDRLRKERRQGRQADDLLLTKEDLIGPDPSKVMAESATWKELQSMIGLGAVKRSVANMFSMVVTNYQRELLEKAPLQVSLNRVFLGSPGTGKTTVGKHYGQILAELGLISNGEVVMKNPADFIGSHLGESEQRTKAILDSTVGKVLIIDEAYMLYGGVGGNSGVDSYKTAVIDTIVAEVQSVPGEDRCVLMLGYKQQIEEMFQNVNPGLSRRFAIEDAFHFDDYTDDELLQALEWKMKKQDLAATEKAKTVAIEVLSRARNRPNFGNIGEVENLLSQAKIRYQARQTESPAEQRSVDAPFEPQDFDPGYNRAEDASTNLAKLFEDVVGCEEIVKKLSTWQQMARNMKARGRDPRDHIPTNFVFKGPPGTGKTTTARKMGHVYYDMGFLSSTEVVECSASDLVGQYVGHTGPKTRKLFEKALGRVLFIDEAYRLSEGHFAKEAMDELVGILTQEAFRAKLIVILAGYDQDMNDLMAVNTGLSSRFPDEIVFHNITPVQCIEIMKRKLGKEGIRVDALDDGSCAEYAQMVHLLGHLSQLPSWGNARDLETLSKQMTIAVYSTPSQSTGPMTDGRDTLLTLSGETAVACVAKMLSERSERTANRAGHRPNPILPMQQLSPDQSAPPPPAICTAKSSAPAPPQPAMAEDPTPSSDDSVGRDTGVSDAVWRQLQIDKKAADLTEGLSQALKQTLQDAKDRQKHAEELANELSEQILRAAHAAEQDDLMRRREQARLEDIAARAEAARVAAALKAEESKRREEARIQTKIRSMGVCVAGYRWVKQATGYRCAGGTHFIDNAALGI